MFSLFLLPICFDHVIIYVALQILRDVSSDDVTFTTVALSHSGRMLFCGTSAGTLRSLKFPLTNPGEWQEYQGHCKQIGRLQICKLQICTLQISKLQIDKLLIGKQQILC